MFNNLAHRFRHFFTPHHTNNFRARVLHNSALFALIGIFLAFNLIVRLLDNTPLHILGFTSTVTIDEVVRLTNQERISHGLAPLAYSESLADAARRKAANMLEENYWAHNSPSGLSPWHWFQAAGYNYVHAGENLAKDFGSTDRMLNAWMNSPTHRDNIISPQYQEIGIAVVPGTLLGQETVLVVQLFGSRSGGAVPTVSEVAPTTQGTSTSVETPSIAQIDTPAEPELVEIEYPAPTPPPSTVSTPLPYINEFKLKRLASIFTTVLLLLALVLDLIIAESRSLSRRVGKNWAHIIYINVILILVTLVQAGRIL